VMKMLAVLLLCECLAGCGSSSATNLTANWHFIFTSSANGDTYTGTASLTQSSAPVTSQGAGGLERMLSGTINFTNDPCATTAPISGTISGSNVILTATESGQPVSLTGNVNAAFTAMSGTTPLRAEDVSQEILDRGLRAGHRRQEVSKKTGDSAPFAFLAVNEAMRLETSERLCFVAPRKSP
jgi:hypothetical protein